MARSTTRALSLWSLVALTLVVSGALLSSGVVAGDQPIYVSGADVPAAYDKGNWQQTYNKMLDTYDSYKKADWDVAQVPFDLLRNDDQQYSESKNARSEQVSGFVVPKDPVYSEVAFWCETYYRQNITVYKNKTVCNPKGFFLVMYKDGVREKVDAKDVRMIPHPTIADAEIMVFPRMKQYDPDLPLLPAVEASLQN